MSAIRLAFAAAALLALAAPVALATEAFPNATRAQAPTFEEDTHLANAVGSPLRCAARVSISRAR